MLNRCLISNHISRYILRVCVLISSLFSKLQNTAVYFICTRVTFDDYQYFRFDYAYIVYITYSTHMMVGDSNFQRRVTSHYLSVIKQYFIESIISLFENIVLLVYKIYRLRSLKPNNLNNNSIFRIQFSPSSI